MRKLKQKILENKFNVTIVLMVIGLFITQCGGRVLDRYMDRAESYLDMPKEIEQIKERLKRIERKLYRER